MCEKCEMYSMIEIIFYIVSYNILKKSPSANVYSNAKLKTTILFPKCSFTSVVNYLRSGTNTNTSALLSMALDDGCALLFVKSCTLPLTVTHCSRHRERC